jgi:hypothetical protein
MATVLTSPAEPRARVVEGPPPKAGRTPSVPWLRLVLPIVLLAWIGSAIGLVFEDEIYGRETANWAAQAVGQDIANLIAFPVLLRAAFFASRGSLRGHLISIGVLIYSAYTYAIYSFALHFGPLFLVWVAVLGMSVYALVGALAGVDAVRVKAELLGARGERFAARLLITIGAVFALLWLSEIVPALWTGGTPKALKDVGLLTNPVHVLDLALLLPALVIGGRLLKSGKPLGYVLAPALLVATFLLALGIISLMVVTAIRGLESAPAVGVAIAVLAILEAVTAFKLLRPRKNFG